MKLERLEIHSAGLKVSIEGRRSGAAMEKTRELFTENSHVAENPLAKARALFEARELIARPTARPDCRHPVEAPLMLQCNFIKNPRQSPEDISFTTNPAVIS
jgi:hypothetical protein